MDSRRGKCRLFLVAAGLAILDSSLLAQALGTAAELETISASQLPASMQERFRRIGLRLQKTENARVAYAGILQDSRGARPVEIVIQNPGSVRIAEGGVVGRVTSFDGNRVISSAGALTSDQEKLLETLMADSPEAVFQQLAAGEAFRRIGGGHKVAGTGTGDVPAESVDVYQLFPRGRVTKAVPAATPRFLAFDSSSQVLKYVSYRSAGGLAVTSFFENWKTTGGESHPGRIRRLENGVEVFRVEIQTLQVGTRLAAGQF